MDHLHNSDYYVRYVNQGLDERRAEAARERQARQFRQARPPRWQRRLRARLGRLLIVAGEALARQPIEAACPERA